MVTFQQVDFKLPGNIFITVNDVFNRENIISYEEFCDKIPNIHGIGYLVLKHHLMTILRPSEKYPPPIPNQSVQDLYIER